MSACKFSRKRNSESTYSSRNPLTFADSAYKLSEFHLQCGFHLHFVESTYSCRLYSLVAKFATQQMCRKKMLHVIVRGIQGSFVSGVQLLFETRDKQTQNCAPIRCTVWPRNEVSNSFKKLSHSVFTHFSTYNKCMKSLWKALCHTTKKIFFKLFC